MAEYGKLFYGFFGFPPVFGGPGRPKGMMAIALLWQQVVFIAPSWGIFPTLGIFNSSHAIMQLSSKDPSGIVLGFDNLIHGVY